MGSGKAAQQSARDKDGDNCDGNDGDEDYEDDHEDDYDYDDNDEAADDIVCWLW